MDENQKKKPWSKPELRKLEPTEELLKLFTPDLRDKMRRSGRQTKQDAG